MGDLFFSRARYPQIVVQVWRHNRCILGTARKALLEHGYERDADEMVSEIARRKLGSNQELLWIIGRYVRVHLEISEVYRGAT
ncbi:MAG: hypothetical protein M3497_08980 [Gemmatimonadota bacterium]|jgi:hypothetical protein|nr:hypothetical protein [Gemmatimonadota bacterium]